jgi:type II secretory ATPase GspE/PulE/Tfp pilus assembly ATPase PilB-like protein
MVYRLRKLLQVFSMSGPLTAKIGDLLTQEGLLTREQLAKSILIQKKHHPSAPLGKVCVSLGFVTSTDLAKVLAKHHRRIPLGELLVHLGLITADQVQSALEQQTKQKPHRKLGAVLVEKGYIDEATLIRALYDQSQASDSANGQTGKFHALVAAGRLSQRDLDAVIREAETHRRPVETLLMERHKLRKQEVGAALSLFYKCPFKEYDERLLPAWDYVREINPNYLKANYWIPLQVTDDYVEILIDDPQAYDKIQDVKRLFPGKDIRCAVGLRDDILKYVNAAGANRDKKDSQESIRAILGQLDAQEEEQDDRNDLVIDENHSAIVRLVNEIITDAAKQRVSDIHIEPEGSQSETLVRFRIDGRCLHYLRVP